MRITRIRIGAFGGIRDRDYALTGGADVLYGPNESGKTSTMEFIRSVLSPTRKKRYPEKAKSDNGMLDIEDGGESRVLELGSRDTSGIPEAVRRTDPEVFRRIFVMDPGTLDDSKSVSEGEIRSRFLTIPGGDGVPKAKEWAENAVQNTVGLRGNSPSDLLRIESEISECESKVSELRASADRYGELASQRDVKRREMEALKEASAGDDAVKEVVLNYRNNRGNYERLVQLESERKELGAFVPVTSDDIIMEAELRSKAELAEAAMAGMQETLRRAKADADGADLRAASRLGREIDELPGRFRTYQQESSRIASARPVPRPAAGRRRVPVPVIVGVMLIIMGIVGCAVSPASMAVAAVGAVLTVVGLRRRDAPAPRPRDSDEGLEDLRRSVSSFEKDVDRLCAETGVAAGTVSAKVDALVSLRRVAASVSSADNELMNTRLGASEAASALTEFYARFSGREGFESSKARTATAERKDGEISSIREAISRSGLDPDVPECPVHWEDDGSGERINELNREIGRLDTAMSNILDMTVLESEMDRLESLNAKRAAILRRSAEVLIAKALIDRSCSDAFGSVQPAVVSTASRYISMMAGDGVSLEIDPRDGDLKVIDGDGVRGDGKWSSGLRAQVLLSVKLAIAKEMGGGEIPMVLDDVLLPFDSARKRGALKALAEVSPEMQVILFTCDAETRDLAESEGLSVQSMVR